MPCNSDHMEPTVREKELQETARLLCSLYLKTDRIIPNWIIDEAQNSYCREERLVPELCKEIRNLDTVALNSVVYNPYSRESRRLADWWEDHQGEDAERQKKMINDMKEQIHRIANEMGVDYDSVVAMLGTQY